ncbi:hypothetical protein DdX_03966 [Ditylenchus destructor]|uniref:Uncharacterized protein n=1 Tax=Ditylenchus destructor TaxID=166010 RepID=A0AAD4RBQ1_9BILA|nr:hypothetical protein DdX_03966 [Ditylenchus destructor]
MICSLRIILCFTTLLAITDVFSIKEGVEGVEEESACQPEETFDLQRQPELITALVHTNFTVAGLELVKKEDKNDHFEVFIVFNRGNEVVKHTEPKTSTAPKLSDINKIRFFFERGSDIYVFYIVDKSRLQTRHFHFDQSGSDLELKEMPDFSTSTILSSDMTDGIPEQHWNKLIFGHSSFGFYFSTCNLLSSSGSEKECVCSKGKYCVYDYVASIVAYNYPRIRNSIMCNMIVENDTMVLYEETFSKKRLSCFEKSKNVHQLQFWNKIWVNVDSPVISVTRRLQKPTDNCCRPLIKNIPSDGECATMQPYSHQPGQHGSGEPSKPGAQSTNNSNVTDSASSSVDSDYSTSSGGETVKYTTSGFLAIVELVWELGLSTGLKHIVTK